MCIFSSMLACFACTGHASTTRGAMKVPCSPQTKVLGGGRQGFAQLVMLLSAPILAATFNPAGPNPMKGIPVNAEKSNIAGCRRIRCSMGDQQEMDEMRMADCGLSQPSVLFTCTTYLTKPGKREHFEEVIASLDRYLSPLCAKCIILNEYDKGAQDHSDIVDGYPKFNFIQKNDEQRGQAASLNLILDELKSGGYDYWLQWEESWFMTQDFLSKALNIMSKSDIDQLQLTDGWLDKSDLGFETYDDYVVVTRLNEDFPEIPPAAADWPLFSLRPSMNRVSSILECGRFDTDRNNWPIIFEYMFAKEFAKRSMVKAVICPPAAERVGQHLPTYLSGEEFEHLLTLGDRLGVMRD